MENITNSLLTQSSAKATAPGSGEVDTQLAHITSQRKALEAQRLQLDEAEAKLRAQAEEAIRQRLLGLPSYIGVADLNAVMDLIRRVMRGTPAKSTRRGRGQPIPEEIKEAIARALRAGATVPSICAGFKVSPPWVALFKRKLKLTHRKGVKRVSLRDIPAEKLAA